MHPNLEIGWRHEYNAQGNHRLVRLCCAPTEHQGAWVSYQSPALMLVHGERYFAVTDYFAGDGLSADAIYGYQPVFDLE